MFGKFLLVRDYFDSRSDRKVVVRVTHPFCVQGEGVGITWVCYVEIDGLDAEDTCFPVNAEEPFDAIVSASEILHHRLAPIEEHLQCGDRIGSSFFPRTISLLASKRALERIDDVLREEEPRKIIRKKV